MSPIRMERLEAGVRTILAFTEAFNQRDLPGMLKLISDDCNFEPPLSNQAAVCGKPAISRYWQEYFTGFPQAHRKIEEAFGFGVHCISRWSCDRTDPSDCKSHLRGIDLIRVQDGLITEYLSYIKG
jgi:ketosteroid isomerase-like protein